VTGKLLDPTGGGLLPHVAFTAQILGPYLRACHVNAIVQRIHLGPTHVNGVDQLMHHRLMGVPFAANVLLAEKDFRHEPQFRTAILFGLELLFKVGKGSLTLRQRRATLRCFTGNDGLLDHAKATTRLFGTTIHATNEGGWWFTP